MPLLKKKAFPPIDPPADLRPDELVWKVRFTKEIFRSYEEYLKRINLYCQRVWTCKITGKTCLTYEEALVSELREADKIQQFPKELVAPVLHLVQFSTMRLNDLVTMIYAKLKDHFFIGEELHGRREGSVCPCKILKVLKIHNDEGGNLSYEVGWLDKNKKISCTSLEIAENLIRKRPPLGKQLLKYFIKESTSQNAPWVVCDKLAKEHRIPTEPPEELREKIQQTEQPNEQQAKKSSELRNKKRVMQENDRSDVEKLKKKTKTGLASTQSGESGQAMKVEEQPKVEKIKYPIDDLMVKPGPDDPVFTERPEPSTNFAIPMDSVGNLLMVWNFCSSFSKLLCLSPFSLEELENAVTYQGASNLIIETHSVILGLVIEDQGEYYTLIEKRKKKGQITSKNWTGYLCDFLEMESMTEFSDQVEKIRRDSYWLLDACIKLKILSELVYWVLMTDAFREQLDNYIEQQQALMATKREEDLEEARKRKEEKQLKYKDSNNKNSEENVCSENGVLQPLGSMHSHGQTGDTAIDANTRLPEPNVTPQKEIRGSKHAVLISRRANMNQKLEAKVAMEIAKEKAIMEERMTQIEKRKKLREIQRAKEKEKKERELKEKRELHFDRAIEKLFIRTNTLGKDRDYNRYWFFQHEGRIFVESSVRNCWGFYNTKEELDGLIGSLNPKGERERALQRQLDKNYSRICTALQKRSKETVERSLSDTAILRRSVRVSVLPKDNGGPSFLNYRNKLRV